MPCEETHIIVSTIADQVKEKHLRIKPIINLQSGDYIVGCHIPDQVKEKHLSILPYDDIGNEGMPTRALGSIIDDNGYESDMRIIPMPCGVDCTWIDITENFTPTVGTWDGTQYHPELLNVDYTIRLNYTAGQSYGNAFILRALITPDTTALGWLWPNSDAPQDSISPYPYSLYEWETPWNDAYGMRFARRYYNGLFSISKIEACYVLGGG
jgi:hypothetical protein